MNPKRKKWTSFAGLLGAILLTMACALPFPAPPGLKPSATPTATGTSAATATPTPGQGGGSSGGTGRNSNSSGGSSGGSGSGSGSSGGSSGSGSGSEGVEATATQLADLSAGPYVVKQIETLGGEAISGTVCSLTQPFSVLSVTPKVTFTFGFVPKDAQHGAVSYAYSIPAAGETHDAKGTYTLAPVGSSGTLELSLVVSDHVVFKGFDGNIPNRYKFDLVPDSNASC